MGQVYDDSMADLAVEPCVIERDEMAEALMETPAKLRKGMAPQ